MKEERRRRVLILDDDEDILDLISYNLTREGYSVRCMERSTDILAVVSDFRPDLVILDIDMTPYDGVEVCKMIRNEMSNTEPYIFFLTGQSAPRYQNAVFHVGGDEFIEKIVGLKPLMSKVTSVLKQEYVIRKGATQIRKGRFSLDRMKNLVRIDEKTITLNHNEFEVLFFLVQNEGKNIPLRQIINTIWGSTTYMDETSALHCIDNVCRKIGKGYVHEKGMTTFRFDSQFMQ